MPPHRQHLYGFEIDAVTAGQALDRVEGAITTRAPLLVGVVNAAKIVNSRRDPVLRQSVRQADLILADGMAVVWASRLVGRPLPERVAGIDLMEGMLRRGALRGWRFFCLGATEEVNAAACAWIAAHHPGVVLAGRHHGYFSREEEPEVVAAIREAAPDVLLVAMSSPKKEDFLARWSATLEVPVCHGVGGSFDVLAGKVSRAPRVVQDAGLEWAWRVGKEPRRLWRRYLTTNTRFLGLTLREWWRPTTRGAGGAGVG